ncbi:MAG: T9SS type A sorting domain-containing protein [Bacteroidales bacterium]|nr:T9SS type A sorting domain-containing protein [Bacteroidales bacterium]
MKKLNQTHGIRNYFLITLMLLIIGHESIFAQNKQDSTYLPKITIKATNGFGPYVIGDKGTNLFLAYDLPTHTSKITFKFIDSKGKQFGDSYSEEGNYLTSASWYVELDTIDFPLSPRLNIKVNYQSDSTAVYNIAYTVYPDTINFFATAGWGPFMTNNYTRTDTSWHDVPEQLNTFAISNLPPRTDTVKFVILSADSTTIDSLLVFAQSGQYLDSATFTNVRMDSLPLSVRYLQAIMYCEGGPDKGVVFHKDLEIIPQPPHLISSSEYGTLYDSIGTFVQNQTFGQALRIDSIKYALIYNSPGETADNIPPHQLKGPYSIDVIKENYSIESWVKFNKEEIINKSTSEMTYLKVDKVWQMTIINEPGDNRVKLSFSSLEGDGYELFYGYVGYDKIQNSEWHHIAFTCHGANSTFYSNFYFDGEYTSNYIHLLNFFYIMTTNYWEHLLTNPLYVGACTAQSDKTTTDKSLITEIDEIRIWKKHLTAEEIHNNFQKKVLQDTALAGYWDFDDLRNHKKEIYDISYYNNSGMLYDGAVLVPQPDNILKTMDTIIVKSSYIHTDSVQFIFINDDNLVVDTVTVKNEDNKATLIYDISSLPYTISHLQLNEFYPNCPQGGISSDIGLNGLEQSPIATPLLNWQKHYTSPDFGNFFTSLIVSEFPLKTEKVILGLRDENQLYDTIEYTENSFPYHSSLTFNGTDNYIKPSESVYGLVDYTIMLWFKTTTKHGGPIVNFSDSPTGIGSDHTPELYMETNGTIWFETKGFTSYNYLYSEKEYNDGKWHHVAATYKMFDGMKLYIDGNLIGYKSATLVHNFTGYWVIGHGDWFKSSSGMNYHYEGSLTGISFWDEALNYDEVNANRFKIQPDDHLVHYYKLDEGTGTTVHDSKGNINGTLKGSDQDWITTNTISKIGWDANLCDLDTGKYTFIANVFYNDGPQTGHEYPLGNFLVIDPLLGYNFQYKLSEGQGYFQEGVQLTNRFSFDTDFNKHSEPYWKENFVGYKFYSPDNDQTVLSHGEHTYTSSTTSYHFDIDMGDAPPGSYILVQFGFYNTYNSQDVTNTFSIPIYIKPMVPPKITGNFGPFDQAIAPGVMIQENTYDIVTEPGLTELKSVKAKFYDKSNNEIAEKICTKVNDTLWQVTYNMGTLSPPTTMMRFEYYLGTQTKPALIEGPFVITIHKTKPRWFDFLSDSDFHNVQQSGDEVTFSLVTPFEDSYVINNSAEANIPNWVPLLGGSNSKIETPTAEAYLKYNIPLYKLELDQAPEFFQKIFNLGAGTAETFRFAFNYSQDNSYSVDENNNLFARQNFSMGGSVTSAFNKAENIVKKVKELIDAAEATDPASLVISPSFSLSFTGSFEYSSRLNLMVDTNSGKWGSYGNLDVDANPAHTQAYKKSASFHFYSGSLGMEFSLGAKFLDGLVEGDFGLDGRFLLGFGHSYTTIPKNKKKPLKSFAFQTYGRFYITVLWGWYEKTIWGPKMFYNHTIWGDDMTNAFPPMKKKNIQIQKIAGDSSMTDMITEIEAVGWYNKMPVTYPQLSLNLRDKNRIFTWLEPNKAYGERKLRARHFNTKKSKFNDEVTITTNINAIHSPCIDMINDSIVISTWTQTRYTPETIESVKSSDVPRNFVQSQDIWFAVYDILNNTLIKMDFVEDDIVSLNTGRAEGNPEITILSDERALITWHVGDLDTHKSDICFTFIEKKNGEWQASNPAILAETDGIETDLKICSPEENVAVAVWKNTDKSNPEQNRLLTSTFTGSYWTTPEEFLPVNNNVFYNYFDMDFENKLGAITFTSYITDSVNGNYEVLSLLHWNPYQKKWSTEPPKQLYIDSINHFQLPRITINGKGTTAIGFKIEKIGYFDENEKISQIDLFLGNISNPAKVWQHIPANEFVCDTTKQVKGLDISFAGHDTLMLLSHEFIMSATDMQYTPLNGVVFGNPYMNLVLRSVSINEEGYVDDVDENTFFENGNDTIIHHSDVVLKQNFPNPCMNFTTIQFYIPDKTNVRLEIFNLNGERIGILLDQSMIPGTYDVKLDTYTLKNGTYIYKLTTDNFEKSIKMVIGS